MSSIAESTPRPAERTGFINGLIGRLTGRTVAGRHLPLWKQLLMQALLLLIAFVVIFPILWVVSMSLDPRNIQRPETLELIPPGASLQAYAKVIDRPTTNDVTFVELARNSLTLSVGTAFGSVLIGVFAAYAFSRFKFSGRQVLMVAVLTVLMLPSVATLPALYVLLNRVTVTIGELSFNLRNSLLGVGLAMISGMLPFAIWNLKGYLDTIPRELEEAAIIDGANSNQIFFQITLPLAVPALAVTAFLGFMSGWTEFAISWQFLTDVKSFTLAMTLFNLIGQYADNTPWSMFSAYAIVLALPVSLVYLSLQKYIVGGLTIGGVKG